MLDEYEPSVTDCLRSILRPGMTFCDVGANLGVFTLFASRLVGPSGRVVAFEPVPDNVEVLRTNLALNQCQNVLLIEKAVAEKRGHATIHLSALCGCHSLVSQPDGATARSLTVETVPLQEVNELSQIDLLKIDVEGTEMAVLRSLGDRRPKHVVLEYNAERTRAGGANGAIFIQTLRDLGYTNIESLDAEETVEKILAEQCTAANLHAFI
jgi:FkbM family methyltransferase